MFWEFTWFIPLLHAGLQIIQKWFHEDSRKSFRNPRSSIDTSIVLGTSLHISIATAACVTPWHEAAPQATSSWGFMCLCAQSLHDLDQLQQCVLRGKNIRCVEKSGHVCSRNEVATLSFLISIFCIPFGKSGTQGMVLDFMR